MHPEDDNELGRTKAELRDTKSLLKDYKIRLKNSDDEVCRLRINNATLTGELNALKGELSKAVPPVPAQVTALMLAHITGESMPEPKKEKKISWWKFWHS